MSDIRCQNKLNQAEENLETMNTAKDDIIKAQMRILGHTLQGIEMMTEND